MRPPLTHLTVTQLFGGNPAFEAYQDASGHYCRGHNGIDFAAVEGENVYPAWDGTLDIVDSRPYGYGLHAIVTDVHGRSVLYGHLSGILLPAGARVHAHVPFALAGSTGNSTGPHVHFELREAGADWDNGYLGCRDPLGAFDHDVIAAIDLSQTNL